MSAVLVEDGPDKGAIWHFGEPVKEQRAIEAGILLNNGSGKVTIPKEAQAVIVEMAGGGGGGCMANPGGGGGGGGSGTFSKYVIRTKLLPEIVNYTVGVGGLKEKDGSSTIFHTYVSSGGYGSKNGIGGKGGDIYDENQVSYNGGDGANQDGIQIIKEATNGQSGGNSGGNSYGCVEWGSGGAGGGGGLEFPVLAPHYAARATGA